MYIIMISKLIFLMFIANNAQLFANQTLENDNTTMISRRTHQVTTILDGLLKNYQAHIRPNFGGSIHISFDLFIFIN
jgi:hypothetical protein